MNIWYWIGEGATEGFTWASEERRLQNKLIRSGKVAGCGIACYHTWRVLGENVGILGIILSTYFWHPPISQLLIKLTGATLTGIFFYERVFNYISYNRLFPKKSDWDFLNGLIVIPRHPWQDWIFLFVGILIITLGG